MIVTSGEVYWLRGISGLVSLVHYLRRGALALRDFYPGLLGSPCGRFGTAGGALKILTPRSNAIVTSGEVRWLRGISGLVSLVRYLRRGALASRDFYPSLLGTLPQERCIVFKTYS